MSNVELDAAFEDNAIRQRAKYSNIMQVMDQTGHHTVSWNPGDVDEVENAKKSFEELTAAGFNAFRADEKGRQGARIREFDPKAAKIVMVPQLRGG